MRSARWLAVLLALGLVLAVYGLRSGWLVIPPAATIEQDPGPFLSGQVRNADGPVAGARVRYKGTDGCVLTDAKGQFRLPLRAARSTRVTAWKEGYLIGGAIGDSSPLIIQLRRLPTEDAEDYTWIDSVPDPAQPNNCGHCHAEIHEEWSASGHARSVSNRRFLNLYEGSDWNGRRGAGWNLLAEYPDGAGVCTACHAPAVALTDPAYYDLRKVTGVAARGVLCDFCHKVAGVANEHFGLTHGRFGMKLLRPSKGQLFFGPLDDVDRGEDAFSPFYRDSRYCASCHEGTVFGVHVYSTYSEWLESPARLEGKQCQSCHMAPTGSLTNVAPGKGGIARDPTTLANHRLFTGSQLEMLRRALKVTVRLAETKAGPQADVEVRADGVGHRVPTGFVDRQLLLVVDALGKDGKRIPPREGTPVLPALAGNLRAGSAGRLYAKQLTDFDGRQPVPFWRARPEMKDTRLLPGAVDRATYRFRAGVERVHVLLLYRRLGEETARAKGWPDNEIVLVDEVIHQVPGNVTVWSTR